MRIAVFTEVFLPKIDGITNRLSQTIRHLHSLGHEVILYTPRGYVTEFEGCRIIQVPSLPFPPYREVMMGMPHPRLLSSLAHQKPDVVHAVGPACLGVWGLAAARILGLPTLASYHTDFPAYMPLHGLGFASRRAWSVIRWIHKLARINLCPSRHTQRELIANGVKSVGIWRGGVDVDHFNPNRFCQKMRSRMSQGHIDRPLLLFAGRLSFEKSVDTLAPMMRQNPTLTLAIAGDGPARPSLEKHFKGTKTAFLGYLRGAELARAFASADIFVMPSTTETYGFVTLEAMSSGLAVVAAKAGGTKDIVRHGDNGLLYSPGSQVELAQHIHQLTGNPLARARLSSNARQKAETTSWTEETKILERWYWRCLEIPKSSKRPSISLAQSI